PGHWGVPSLNLETGFESSRKASSSSCQGSRRRWAARRVNSIRLASPPRRRATYKAALIPITMKRVIHTTRVTLSVFIELRHHLGQVFQAGDRKIGRQVSFLGSDQDSSESEAARRLQVARRVIQQNTMPWIALTG